MSTHAARARSGKHRPSLYQEITDKIIAELEAARVPWVQPWGTAAAKASLTMPKNATTQRPYSGINVLILWDAVIRHGFSTQNWLTFRQALRLGGNVRQAEHGTTVVYADRFVPDEERERAERDGDEPNAIPFLKRFTVFNTDQCEGLPAELTSAPAPVPDGLILPHAEALIAATGADFRIGGDRGAAARGRISSRSIGTARRCTSLVIGPVAVLDADGNETGIFEVPAGGRRFRALELLVKQKRMKKTEPVPCVLRTDGLAEEDSLAENVQRAALHPLDQFRAFQTLRDKGLSEEDIAARFFVSPTVVKQRLKLAAVSQKLLDVYAFTVTNDQARQEQVWDALAHSYNKEPYHIRRQLTEGAVRR
jgi:ParB/RepB/Spo0J family partition protein